MPLGDEMSDQNFAKPLKLSCLAFALAFTGCQSLPTGLTPLSADAGSIKLDETIRKATHKDVLLSFSIQYGEAVETRKAATIMGLNQSFGVLAKEARYPIADGEKLIRVDVINEQAVYCQIKSDFYNICLIDADQDANFESFRHRNSQSESVLSSAQMMDIKPLDEPIPYMVTDSPDADLTYNLVYRHDLERPKFSPEIVNEFGTDAAWRPTVKTPKDTKVPFVIEVDGFTIEVLELSEAGMKYKFLPPFPDTIDVQLY